MTDMILDLENFNSILDKINQELSVFCKTEENKKFLYSVIIKFEELNNVFNDVKSRIGEELSNVKIKSNVNHLVNQSNIKYFN